MPHDHHKQCLDDSIVVDTSSAPSAGLAATADCPMDDEDMSQTSEAMTRVAMIHLIVRQLARLVCF